MLPCINDKILTIIYKSGKGKIKMAYFLDNSNPDIIVVFEQESIRFPGEFDRVVWSKTEDRFIYGDENEYHMYEGDEEIPVFNTSIEGQKLIETCYRRGLTHCGAVIFDRENKLYKISDIGQEPELIFDANTVASNKGN